jgi:DnaJ-class molecular chaperone
LGEEITHMEDYVDYQRIQDDEDYQEYKDKEEDDQDGYRTCKNCDGKGWGYDFKGGIIPCPECGGRGDNDSDPQCVCGTYASEHRMLGCGNFQTKGQWAAERDMIVHMDDDSYESYSRMMEGY